MYYGSIKKLSDLKYDSNDAYIGYNIAVESNLYPIWLNDNHYKLLSNFLKYRYGIVVRQGYVFCNSDFSCHIVMDYTFSIPYDKIIVMKGLF